MVATLDTRLYSFISKSINTDTMFVSGLIARSSFPGSPARRHLSHLLTTVSMKYDRSPHRGNTAHQWITWLIYSPEDYLPTVEFIHSMETWPNMAELTIQMASVATS